MQRAMQFALVAVPEASSIGLGLAEGVAGVGGTARATLLGGAVSSGSLVVCCFNYFVDFISPSKA